MSPTSYQTAPPRDNRVIICAQVRRVKRIINKINNLRNALILLSLSRPGFGLKEKFVPRRSPTGLMSWWDPPEAMLRFVKRKQMNYPAAQKA